MAFTIRYDGDDTAILRAALTGEAYSASSRGGLRGFVVEVEHDEGATTEGLVATEHDGWLYVRPTVEGVPTTGEAPVAIEIETITSLVVF